LGSFVPSFGRKNNQDKSEERPYDALLKSDDEPKTSPKTSSTAPTKSNVPTSSNVPPKSNVPTSSNVPPKSNVPTSSHVPPRSNVPTSAPSTAEQKKDIPNADPNRPDYKNLPRTAKDDVFDSFVSSRVDDYVREETIVDKIVKNLKFIIPGVIVLIIVIFILVRCNSNDNTPKPTTPPQSTPTETLPPSDTSSESSDASSSEATSEDASSEEDTTSDGPLTMVDVKGMDKDKAKKAIEGIVSGITVKFKEKNSDDVKAGKVMDQSVAANENFAPGEISEVTLTVSAGPAKVTVPSVSNMNRASAINTLKKAGLKAKISRSDYSSDFGKDRVISQSPSGKVDPGTTVSLVISKGPKPAPKKTPAPTQKPSSSSTKPTATKKPSPIG
jgi:cytoskeletal protein RodZ